MKNLLVRAITLVVFMSYTGAVIHLAASMNHEIKIDKLELKNIDAQYKELQIEYDQLNQNLDTEVKAKKKNQDKIEKLEEHRKELEKKLQAKNEAVEKAVNVATGTSQAHAMPENEAKAFIYQHESGNRLDAVNPSSGACGLGQRLSCQILINDCPNWKTDYTCQDRHFTLYMEGRYQTWENARIFWEQNHWW